MTENLIPRPTNVHLAFLLWCHYPRIAKLWVPDPTAPYEGAVKWSDKAAMEIADALIAGMSATPAVTSVKPEHGVTIDAGIMLYVSPTQMEQCDD